MSSHTTVILNEVKDIYSSPTAQNDKKSAQNDRNGFTLILRSERAFTLIELLVVISIIAILSVIGITVFSGVQKSARDSRRKADLHQIQLALEAYNAAIGAYPGEAGWCDSSKGDTSSDCASYVGNFWPPGGLINLQTQGYMPNMPLDPINDLTHYYYYEPVNVGQTQFGVTCSGSVCAYIVSTALENTSDSAAKPGCNPCLPAHNYCIYGGGAHNLNNCFL